MRRSRGRRPVAIALAASIVLWGAPAAGDAPPPVQTVGPLSDPSDDYEPVPRAVCGPQDAPETGLQGQVPWTARATVFDGFSCNLVVAGRFAGDGAGIQLAAYRHCAYYHSHRDDTPGVVVLDVSNPAAPAKTAYLTDASMAAPWESLKVHEGRGLLAAVQASGPGFSIYDVSQDCAHPVHRASIDIPGARGHAGNFAADGLTYYGAGYNGDIHAIDVSNPADPRLLLTFDPPTGVHDLSTNANGTRLYVADSARVAGVRQNTNGLVILDTSQVQARAPQPQVSPVATLHHDDGAVAQQTQRIVIGGTPYLFLTDEMGSGGLHGWAAACASKLPPFGFARLVDMTTPDQPSLAARIMLEVNDPANCPLVLSDSGTSALFSYDAHYCQADNPADARLLACSWYESGLRVFDISSPAAIREVAYFNPGAVPGPCEVRIAGPAPDRLCTDRPGSVYLGAGTTQWILSMPQFRIADCAIWTTATHSGFLVLRLTGGVGGCA